VRSPSTLREILGDGAATRRVLVDGWLDTGDLGFELRGELHVHGRVKDLIVVRGANHAPEEFEAALAGVPGLRAGCAVALGFQPADAGGEALLVLCERAKGPAADAAAEAGLEARARRAVLERTGVDPHTLRILAPGALPRTSSGKLRRGEARRRFEAGTLSPPRRVGLLQLAAQAARSALAMGRARVQARALALARRDRGG